MAGERIWLQEQKPSGIFAGQRGPQNHFSTAGQGGRIISVYTYMKNDLKDSSTPLQITRRKKILFIVSYLLFLSAFIIITSEIILRVKGFKPWRKAVAHLTVRPGGKLYAKNSTLGYVPIPGEFTITLPDGYQFRATHLPDTHRITHPLSTYDRGRQKEGIWIFGCSFTYGWSLNDQETFPWILQERFPEYEFVNFGVGGYGTVQSLLQLREALAKGQVPKMVILVFGNFHDERNILARSWQKEFAPYNKLGTLEYPYARLDQNGKLNYYMGKVEFREFPFMQYSALANFAEIIYEKLQNHYRRIDEVTKDLLLEFANTAIKRKILVVIADICHYKDPYLSFAQENGFKAVDISVDPKIKSNTNYPHDNHPSASANRQYAHKLETFLRNEALK
jgi:hypothetical protein